MSGRSARKASRPSRPSGIAVTVKPSRSSASWVASRMTSSSSTKRTWVLWPCRVALSPRALVWRRVSRRHECTARADRPAEVVVHPVGLGVNRPAVQWYVMTSSPDG